MNGNEIIWNYGLDSRANGCFHEWRPWFVKKVSWKILYIWAWIFRNILWCCLSVEVESSLIEHSKLVPLTHRSNWQTSSPSHESPHCVRWRNANFIGLRLFFFPHFHCLSLSVFWGFLDITHEVNFPPQKKISFVLCILRRVSAKEEK